MGIKDLLPFLRPITKHCHITSINPTLQTSSYKNTNLSVAIDGNAWLHRASFTCSKEIALNGEPKPAFWNFLVKRIQLLKGFKIKKLLVVFDGLECPMKYNENRHRDKDRETALEKAKAADLAHDSSLANTYYARAVSITYDLVHMFASILQELGVSYMIAPYEADAQLAYFSKHGFADLIITEDSDLLVYGCRQVFYKMDEEGYGDLICFEDIAKSPTLPLNYWISRDPSISIETYDDYPPLPWMIFACLLGCDYHPRIRGIGLKSAIKLVDDCPSWESLKQKLIMLNHAPDSLWRAILTFRHHIVYNPISKATEYLHRVDDRVGEVDLSFLGELFPKDISRLWIYGSITPNAVKDELQRAFRERRNKVESMTIEKEFGSKDPFLGESTGRDLFEWNLFNISRNPIPIENDFDDSLPRLKEFDSPTKSSAIRSLRPLDANVFISPCISKRFRVLKRNREAITNERPDPISEGLRAGKRKESAVT